ncbi:unnamed protein product [Pedinophyceae sp. YPF-701]|nr:unnamed protein product [Pedinophyceae sp. YPF-701]
MYYRTRCRPSVSAARALLAPSSEGARAELAELVNSMPDADLPAALRHLKDGKHKEPPFDEDLEPGVIRHELHGHILRCARETNGNWHDCYEETDEECSEFYKTAVELVNEVYTIGVKERRCVGRCHVALLTIADLTEELESVPLRKHPTESWGEMWTDFPLQTGVAGPIHHIDFMDRVRFVWRDLLRVAAGLEGGVTDLSLYFIRNRAAPLRQMIADALAYKCDVLNERNTGHEEECSEEGGGTEALRSFLKQRRKEFRGKKKAKKQVPVAWTFREEPSDDKEPTKPLPVELIPDPELREGARKLAEAVAGTHWEDVDNNYTHWEGLYPRHDGRFDSPSHHDDDDEEYEEYEIYV